MENSLSRSPVLVSNRPVHRWLIVACTTCCAFLPVIALCDDHVSGQLTAKAKAVELKHVYAFWKPRLMDEKKIDMYVLLSDQIIAPDFLPANDDGIAKMAGLVRDNKIHAIELHFDGATNKLFEGEQGAVYDNDVAMARQGVTGALQYQPVTGKPSVIAGSVVMDKTFIDALGWNVRASFEVPAPAKP
jgi:hypothetical protein